MKKHNPANERIKRKYLIWLKEAKQYSEPVIDAAAKTQNRFEVYSNFRVSKPFILNRLLPLSSILSSRKGSVLARN